MSNELQHWGIKGMKWGVRRYQNADGSLTPAGKKRYRDESESIERELSGATKKPASVEDYQTSIKTANSASDTIDAARRLKDDSHKIKDPKLEKKKKKSTEQMSDKELQQRVQRLNMEDNYTRMMMHREHLKQGEDYVNKALDISAVAVRGTTTALTIALLIKQLRG